MLTEELTNSDEMFDALKINVENDVNKAFANKIAILEFAIQTPQLLTYLG